MDEKQDQASFEGGLVMVLPKPKTAGQFSYSFLF